LVDITESSRNGDLCGFIGEPLLAGLRK